MNERTEFELLASRKLDYFIRHNIINIKNKKYNPAELNSKKTNLRTEFNPLD